MCRSSFFCLYARAAYTARRLLVNPRCHCYKCMVFLSHSDGSDLQRYYPLALFIFRCCFLPTP